ncbi:MAG: gamma-D-glutamyl-{L}-meso-diaminopimelate peptidase metallo peptidase family, partial [Clostridia bacterium]|nr:gamma-D-glutamyl-{L}-meso-diaminopimelate peptidase metallo peptidase family [Clostridia bacterium]
IPMVNPDGVNLVTGCYEEGSPEYKRAQQLSLSSIPFPSGWTANIRGVDLNLNYPAGWENAKMQKFNLGYTSPRPFGYVGPAPLSEPESRAIVEFTKSHDFKIILAYHSQGEIIFWKYLNYFPPRSLQIAYEFSSVSGYAVEETPLESGYAGYKDWFIQEYNRPGYTIEVGKGTNPLPISQFPEIYKDNIGILTLGAILS